MATEHKYFECEYCKSATFDNIKDAENHEKICYMNPDAPMNEEKHQYLLHVSTSGSGYTYPYRTTEPLTEGEFIKKYSPVVAVIGYIRLDKNSNLEFNKGIIK